MSESMKRLILLALAVVPLGSSTVRLGLTGDK